jgi:hypothetical protein
MRHWLSQAAFCFAVAALAAPPAEAAPRSVVGLEQAMSCKHMLHPRLLLLALQRDGVIGLKARAYEDGLPYFSIKKQFRIHGLEVKYVEGWDWDYRGGLFRRGPGTAPGRFIGIVLKGDRATVNARFGLTEWFNRTGGGDRDWGIYSDDGVPYFDSEPGLTEVICTTSP